MSERAKPLGLFEGYGIEIEYMVVDADTLAVRPWTDRLLRAAAGAEEFVSDHDDGDIGWSNELVAHVLEFKTSGPVPGFEGVAAAFDESLDRAQAILRPWNAMLMPTGMHPWMDPAQETRLWAHEGSEIYQAYDRIFHCRRHGWSNLQSVHLNLPFANDAELGRLLAAARLVLPMLPALAASSPFAEGKATGMLDTRLHHYKQNATLVPSMAGAIIPEPIYTEAQYRDQVLGRIDAELAPHDPQGILVGHEWLNARGAIVRFDRMALELRLLDTQECPRADLAIAMVVADTVQCLAEGMWLGLEEQQAFPHEVLAQTLEAAIERGPKAPVHRELGRAFDFKVRPGDGLGDLWAWIMTHFSQGPPELDDAVDLIVTRGTLAERILRETGPKPSPERLREVYAELCACLASGRLFGA